MIDVSGNGHGMEMLDTVLDKLGVSKIEGKKQENNRYEDHEKTKEPVDVNDVFHELPSSNVIKVELSQEKLMELLQEQLDESFPMTLKSLVVSRDSSVVIEADIDRDTFIEHAEEKDSPIAGAQILLLKLAPKNLSLKAGFELSYDPSSGELNVDPEDFTVEKLSIPVSLIPNVLTEKFNIAVDGYVSQFGYSLNTVEFGDGYIRIYIE